MANEAWQITSPGTLTLQKVGPSIPMLGPKQALVRMHAVSLNFRDRLVVDNDSSYPVKHKQNLIPSSDGAGVVEEAGPESIWKHSDRVVVHPNTWKHGIDPRGFKIDETMGGGEVDGTLRRWMVVNDDMLFRAPEGLSLEEASTMYTAGVTAFRALFYGGRDLKPGVTVLTQGTGGVSCYAIMIAAAAGATVVATSSSDEKLAVAQKLGAKHLINYRHTPDWATEVLKATGGNGVDIVVDVVGAESIEQTLNCTAFGGLVVLVGVLSKDSMKSVSIMNQILFGAKTLRGQLGAGSKDLAEELSAFLEKHRLHPPIVETFDFKHADKALGGLTKLSGAGKLVVRC